MESLFRERNSQAAKNTNPGQPQVPPDMVGQPPEPSPAGIPSTPAPADVEGRSRRRTAPRKRTQKPQGNAADVADKGKGRGQGRAGDFQGDDRVEVPGVDNDTIMLDGDSSPVGKITRRGTNEAGRARFEGGTGDRGDGGDQDEDGDDVIMQHDQEQQEKDLPNRWAIDPLKPKLRAMTIKVQGRAQMEMQCDLAFFYVQENFASKVEWVLQLEDRVLLRPRQVEAYDALRQSYRFARSFTPDINILDILSVTQ